MSYCDIMINRLNERCSVCDMIQLAAEGLIWNDTVSDHIMDWYQDDIDEVCRVRIVRLSLTDPHAKWMLVNDNPYEDPLSVFIFADLTGLLEHVRRIYHDVYIQ